MVTEPEDKVEEISHVKEALQNCGYGEWTVFRARSKEQQVNTADGQENTGKKYLPRFLMWRAYQKS